MKNDQQGLDNGNNLFQQSGFQNIGAMGLDNHIIVTTSITTTGATAPACTSLSASSSTNTTQTASSPIMATGSSETNILMSFIQQQMLDLKLQVRSEVSQVLSENERQ